MSKSQEEMERHCRLDGKQPTMKEKWQAFYRLWRMSSKYKPHEAEDCFKTLLGNWKWINVCVHPGEIENRILPVEIRWSMVRRLKEKRRDDFASRLLKAIMGPIGNIQ